jgi:hypothetical protein
VSEGVSLAIFSLPKKCQETVVGDPPDRKQWNEFGGVLLRRGGSRRGRSPVSSDIGIMATTEPTELRPFPVSTSLSRL